MLKFSLPLMKEALKDAGFSYRHLADILGRDTTTIWRQLNGRTELAAATVLMVAELTNYNLERFVCEETE